MHMRGCVAFVYVYLLRFPQRKDYAKAAKAFPHELSFVQLQAGVPGQGVGAEDKAGIEGVAGVAKDITEGLMVHEGLALKGASYTAALLEACHKLGDITWQIQVSTDILCLVYQCLVRAARQVAVRVGVGPVTANMLLQGLNVEC